MTIVQNLKQLLMDAPAPPPPALEVAEAVSHTPRKQGAVTLHPRGFGFVQSEDGDEYFVPPAAARGLLPGDVISFLPEPGRKPGALQAAQVLLRARKESVWLGRLSRERDRTVLVPDEPCLATLVLRSPLEYVDPDVVVSVRVPAHSGEERRPSASCFVRLERVLGAAHRPGFDQQYALARYDFPLQFPAAVLDAADAAASRVQPTDHVPCQSIPFVTIDGETTRDLDDAVWAEALTEGWRVLVAIADVSHFVQPGGELDKAARARGTSVYLPEKVLPMLPETLSTGVCSLNPGVDRLALVADLLLGADGRVETQRFYRAVIRSAARLTYDEVQLAKDGAAAHSLPPAVQQDPIARSLAAMWSVKAVLSKARRDKGLLEFENPEPRLVSDATGTKQLDWAGRLDAHKLVEELMLLANRAAATELSLRADSGLFRHQPAPAQEDWESLRDWAAGRSHALPDSPDMEAAAALTNAVEQGDRLKANLQVRGVMRPATYHQQLGTHFSLSFASYTHFTSPIRRYADLVVHRLLTGALVPTQDYLEAVSQQCSDRSRGARLAERLVWDNIKKQAMWTALQSSPRSVVGHVVSQSRRGLRLVIEQWQASVLVAGAQAEQMGLQFDSASESWQSPEIACESGTQLRLRVHTRDSASARLELLADIEGLA